MPIELIDKIKPKGSFPLVDAEDVSVGNKSLSSTIEDIRETVDSIELRADRVSYVKDLSNTTVSEALDDIYSILTAAPSIEKLQTEDKISIGQRIFLNVRVKSPASPSVIISVSKKFGNIYNVIKTLTMTQGDISIDLGIASVVEKSEYRVSVTDMRGTVAESNADFTITVGSIQFDSNLDKVLQTTVLKSGWNTISMLYSLNYPDGDSPMLKLSSNDSSVKIASSVDSNAKSDYVARIEKGSNKSLTFYIYFETSGSYELTLQSSVMESSGEITTSAVQLYNLAVLEDNYIYTNLIGISPESITTNSVVRIKFSILHSTNYIDESTNLNTTCKFVNANDNTQTIESTYQNVRINTEYTWNFGKLPLEGTWDYEITTDVASGGNSSTISQIISGSIEVSKYEGLGNSYTTAGLVAFFDAAGKVSNLNEWTSVDGENNPTPYKIILSNLTHGNLNGWKVEEETQRSYLKLSTGTYGIMYDGESLYRPFDNIKKTLREVKDYTLEFCYRARCSGDYDAVAISCSSGASSSDNGIVATFKEIDTTLKATHNTTYASEDEWIHVCIVFSNIAETSSEELEDRSLTSSIKTYINGVLSKYTVIPELTDNSNLYSDSCLPLCLNGTYDTNNILHTGDTEIQCIRIYSKALLTEEILRNYISCIPLETIQKQVTARNSVENINIPVLYLVRDGENNFETLHTITKKKSDNASEPTSKNYFVKTKVYDMEPGSVNPEIYENVSVYLQGTSSLKYPVKNYQFKFYDAQGNKKPIIPHSKQYVKDQDNTDKWNCASYVYTLKCDYMEQSHKNNTPTAKFYDLVLDEIVDEDSKYSPARQTSVYNFDATKYRDTIDGFPVLVYYCDKEDSSFSDSGTMTKFDSIKTASTYAGTYMFNIDKSGDQLGFEISSNDVVVSNLKNGTKDLYDNGKFNLWTYSGDVDTSEFDPDPANKQSTDIYVDTLPCISYEGASNVNISAGTFYTLDEYNAYVANGDIKDEEGNILGAVTNWSEYINQTLEPRFNYAEDYEDTDEDKFRNLTFGHMRRAIEWVASFYSDGKLDEKKLEDKFRNEFSNYFSYEYCLTYYLQMMFFTQIDNAGKNAMFDVWYDGVLYPRPYDMDSQMGETNTGEDKVLPSAELPELTPYKLDRIKISNQASENSKSHTRFSEYNTSTNRLWNLFGKVYASEIADKYASLRNSVYTLENVTEFVESLTSDVIGEVFYNKDAVSKYLSLVKSNNEFNPEHLPKLQGNRSIRYKEFLKQRIIFLDTYFNYKGSSSLNTNMTGRSNANNEGYDTVTVGISSYSPQYFRVDVGSTADGTGTVYVDPDLTYVDERTGRTQNGVQLTLPTRGGNKELEFVGVGNFKEISNIENLYLTELQCSNATKLLSINLSNSPKLETLSLGSNKFLRELNVSGSGALTGLIDVSGCENLEKIDISNTKVQSLMLPQDASLLKLSCKNTMLTEINIQNQPFLTEDNIDLEECNVLKTITIRNCSKITSLDLSSIYSLTNITIENCENLTSLVLSGLTINALTIQGCSNLSKINLNNCSGACFTSLRLNELENLSELHCMNVLADEGQKIKLCLPTKIEKLNICKSQIYAICYNIQNIDSASSLDFSELPQLSELYINANIAVEKIENLTYKGNCTQLFRGCTALKTISNCEVTSTDGYYISTASPDDTKTFADKHVASYLCYDCMILEEFDFSITNAEDIAYSVYTLYNCRKIKYVDAAKFFRSLSSLQNASAFFYRAFRDCDTSITLDNNLFENSSSLLNISYIFSGAKLSNIASNSFDSLTNVTIARGMFHSCSSLTKVPYNILHNMNSLENIDGAFANCTSMSVSFPEDYTGKMLFYIPKNVTNTNGMFLNCQNIQLTDIVNTIGDCLKIRSTIAMFYGCKSIQPETLEGIFDKLTYLENADYMFAKCCPRGTTNIDISVNLPEYLSGNRLDHFVSAAGMFYDCMWLHGRISANFFVNTPNLENIGTNYVHNDSGVAAEALFSTGGMFSNTNIEAFHEKFLYPLTNLTNVAMLFFQGSGGGTSSPYNDALAEGFVVYSKENDSDPDAGIVGSFTDDNTTLTTIPLSLFEKQQNLTNVEYMFAGNTRITGFHESQSEEGYN